MLPTVTQTTVITTTTTEYVSEENNGDLVNVAATEPIIRAVANNEFASQPVKDKEGKPVQTEALKYLEPGN